MAHPLNMCRNQNYKILNLFMCSLIPKHVVFNKVYFSAKPSQKEEELESQSLNYVTTKLEYKMGKKYTVSRLCELLNIKLATAIDIATRHKKLQLTTGRTMIDSYNFLKMNGISKELIIKYPETLSHKDLEMKVELLQQLSFALQETLPLVNISFAHLQHFIHKQETECKIKEGGRIGFISRMIEVPIVEVCDFFASKTFLRSIALTKLEINYTLLTEFGITHEEILRDLWVLRYNTDVIKERLILAKNLNAGKIKTWMVRPTLEIFNTYIQRRSDNKSILGDNSLAEYLSERLHCSLEQSKVILTKHRALANKQMKKLKEIIDFLYEYGFTPLHIVRHPKILLHSVETTKKRLNELQAQSVQLDSLYILTKSQKQYMNYYENLIKTNKNKTQETD